MKKTTARIFALMLSVLMLVLLCGCGDSNDHQSSQPSDSSSDDQTKQEGNEKTMNYDTKNPVVEIVIKGYGTVVAELYPDIAPNTVNNFISLVKKGFYDNNTIHRVQKNFVLQGGDPTGTGTGGPGYSIKGEFSANGFANNLSHSEGVLSMARSPSYDSAGSQFFIMLTDYTGLDGAYAAFGKVIEGMDIVHNIEKSVVTFDSMGMLDDVLTIEKVYVDTHGVDYPEPEKVK